MSRFFYILTFNIILTGAFAQNAKQTTSFSDGLGAADYSLNLGTQIGTTFKDSYFISNYFSPNAKFDLSKKFSLVVGMGVNYTQLNNMPIYSSEFKNETVNATQTSFFTYVSGIYKLSPKVNLNATIMYEDVMQNYSETPMALKQQYKDVSLGLNYNVTRNFSINAQMQLSDRPYNNFNNGISNFGINSPFVHSPFY